MNRRLLLTVAALAIVLAGCGDDDDTADATAQDSSTTAEETTTTAADTTTTMGEDYGGGSATTAAGDGAGESAVTIADFTFDPATIEVAVGTTVTWTNEDGAPHTVSSGTPAAPEDTFDERLDPGAEAEVTFDEAGTFAYFCAIHPSMTGEVVVS